jgi:hypothetical protein
VGAAEAEEGRANRERRERTKRAEGRNGKMAWRWNFPNLDSRKKAQKIGERWRLEMRL